MLQSFQKSFCLHRNQPTRAAPFNYTRWPWFKLNCWLKNQKKESKGRFKTWNVVCSTAPIGRKIDYFWIVLSWKRQKIDKRGSDNSSTQVRKSTCPKYIKIFNIVFNLTFDSFQVRNAMLPGGAKRRPSFKMVSNMVIQLLHSIKYSVEVPFSNMAQQPVDIQKGTLASSNNPNKKVILRILLSWHFPPFWKLLLKWEKGDVHFPRNE